MRLAPLLAGMVALVLPAGSEGAPDAAPVSRASAGPSGPGFDCSWQDVRLSEGLAMPQGGPVEIVRPFGAIRLFDGTFYRLEACAEPVGLAWSGNGEVEIRDPGAPGSHLVRSLYENVPGLLGLRSALIVASDGTVPALLGRAGPPREGTAPLPDWPFRPGEIPPDVRGFVRSRTAPFDPALAWGSRLPGDLLWAPTPELGGLLADLKVEGIRFARPGDSLEPAPRWLTLVWSDEGGLTDLEPGVLMTRAAGTSQERLLLTFPPDDDIEGLAGPYAWHERPRRFDLAEVDVAVRVARPGTWDRDVMAVDLDATLDVTAAEGAGRVVPFWLMEGRARTLGSQWEGARIGRVEVDGVAAAFDRAGDRLFVHLAEEPEPGRQLAVRVVYGGALLEPEGTSAVTALAGMPWYPRLGSTDRHSLSVTAVLPRHWDAAATGRRTEEYDDGRTRVVVSRTKGQVEDGGLFIQDGRTQVFRAPGPGLPVLRVVRHPDTSQAAARIGSQVWDHLRALADVMGPFPYRELEIVERGSGAWTDVPGVIVLPGFDSPPDQVITTRVGEHTLLEALARQYVVADMGALSYHDRWLEEGLGCLAECVALEAAGRGERCSALLRGRRDAWLRQVDAESQPSTIGPVWAGPMSSWEWPNDHLRGPLVMHRLRLLLGEEGTRDLLRRVVAAYRGQRLSTLSFMVHAAATAGSDLRRFFYGWIFATPPEPVARVSWAARARQDGSWDLDLAGRIDGGERAAILSPVMLTVEAGGESHVRRLLLTEDERTVTVTGFLAEPVGVAIEPGRTFPGTVELSRIER